MASAGATKRGGPLPADPMQRFRRSFFAHLPAVLPTCFASFGLLVSVSGQTPLAGALQGQLGAGVYHASSITVPTNTTLILDAGVILKFQPGTSFLVDGRLLANGTTGAPVILTDIQDDSAGGDTNGNGPSVGSRGAWQGLHLRAGSDLSILQHTEIRYGGAGFVDNLTITNASPTLQNVISRDGFVRGMRLAGASTPAVANCSFRDNNGLAVLVDGLHNLVGFAGNTASGNGMNHAEVPGSSVQGNLVLQPANMLNGAFVLNGAVNIPAGASLTLQAGCVVKFRGGFPVVVDGRLLTQGTSQAPVVFTDFADDSAGGDTNGNGASSGIPGTWQGLRLGATAGQSSLLWTEVRYGGANFVSNIIVTDSSPEFRNCTSRNGFTHGMRLDGTASPIIADCSFRDNNSLAIQVAGLHNLVGLAGNTASGNGQNFAEVPTSSIQGNLMLQPANMLNGAFVLNGTLTIPSGASLVLQAGSVIKFRGGFPVVVDGSLITQGSSQTPVVFTALADDSVGGDTNGNGPSTGSPGTWQGLRLNATAGQSLLLWTEVRYGGANFVPNILVTDSSPEFHHCTSRNGFTHGMRLDGTATPLVERCSFLDNGGRAVTGLELASLRGFANNSATGNQGNYLEITRGQLDGLARIEPQMVMNGAIVLAANLNILATGELQVAQGVVLKVVTGLRIEVHGSLDVRGSGYEPVVLTSLADDEFGGDTNGDGLSSGSPGSWQGMVVAAGTGAVRLQNLRLRFAGAGFISGLTIARSQTLLRSVRVDRAFATGFALGDLLVDPTNLVAYGCSTGIQLQSGSYNLLHATSTQCSVGIRRENSWSGRVTNSISFGNSTNFQNFTSSQVHSSNGAFVGTNGNLNVDPQFLQPASGDLRLMASSPCLGAAEFFAALWTQRDHDGNSRMLDHNLVGWPAPDMGAFERAIWTMDVFGTASPGNLLAFVVTGPPGQSFVAMGLVGNASFYLPWGMLLVNAGPGEVPFLLSPLPVPVGTPVLLPLANSSALLGLVAGVQSLTFPSGSFAAGNMTRLYEMLIRP